MGLIFNIKMGRVNLFVAHKTKPDVEHYHGRIILPHP